MFALLQAEPFSIGVFDLLYDYLIQWSFGFMGGASPPAKLGRHRPCERGDITF